MNRPTCDRCGHSIETVVVDVTSPRRTGLLTYSPGRRVSRFEPCGCIDAILVADFTAAGPKDMNTDDAALSRG